MSKTIPPELRQDPGWRGALHILESGFPSERSVVWQYVNPVQRVIDFDGMQAGGAWSHGELLLIQAAASLFNPRQTVSLWEMVSTLDNDNLELVVDAIRESGGLQ